MSEVVKIVPLALYLFIGAISLLMAVKLLLSKKYLPFHEEASGKPWEEIDGNLRHLILSLMKVSGLGFLIVSILLFIFPVYNYFRPHIFIKYAVPLIALLFCTGLFVTSFILFKQTNAKTPWKKSLIALAVLLLAIILSGI